MIPTIDFAVARKNMIDCQIRPNKVTDSALLEALGTVPREVFLPYDVSHIAYIDEAVAVAPKRSLLPPTILARLIQALNIQKDDRVLVIGGLTGYSAALLAHLAGHVVVLDHDSGLIEQAKRNFAKLGLTHIEAVTAALAAHGLAQGSFQKILVEGAVAQTPDQWEKLLAPGGVMAVIEAPDRSVGRAILVSSSHRNILFDANAPYISGFEPAPVFSF